MFGQGSPTRSHTIRASALQAIAATIVCAVIALFCSAARAQTDASRETLNLRFEWGGGARAQQWTGTIVVDDGSFAGARLLGIEADEPASIWIEAGQIQIQQPSQRTYDGVDAHITAAADAEITVAIQPLRAPSPKTIKIPVSSLVVDEFRAQLDEHGNQLLVRRTPGDRLRVDFDRDALVFGPGEQFSLSVAAHRTGAPAGSELRLRAELTAARGDDMLWFEDFTLRIPPDGRAPVSQPLDVPLPQGEGVYDLRITAVRRNWLRGKLLAGKPLAARTVQLVVVSPEAPTAGPSDVADWQTVLEIDPANPRWWARLPRWMKLDRFPGLRKGPLGSGHAVETQHTLGRFIRIEPRTGSSEPSWQAYPLPIKNPGTPHILEVEYPSDVAQHLGIRIVEPNAAGEVVPLGVDSGVYSPPDASGQTPVLRRYRLAFWPKTEAPLLLVSNRLKSNPAMFGKIRVLAGPPRLAHEATVPSGAAEPDDGRLVAAFLDRPLFPEVFSATQAFDAQSEQTIDDWKSFYDGATRMVDYLHHAGYNGLMMSVLADGSTIYPSRLVKPTPLHDTGSLSSQAHDPVRKDVLEMLFRLFDRERLRLTPVLHFAAPLPELEALRRREDAAVTGIQWVGADGATWQEHHAPRRGQAPYYNVLHPRVQQAMLSVADELVERYGHHRSFHGLALRMSGMSYAQMPGAEWGFDDRTIAQFEQATGLSVPGDGSQRFARRAEFLTGEKRDTWLEWRASVLARFHRQLAERISRAKTDAPLILETANMFDTFVLAHRLRPVLPRQARLDQLMLEVGLQPQRYAADSNIRVLRPRLISPGRPLAERGVDIETNRLVDLDQSLTTGGGSASLFYHPPQRARLPSFDVVNPFGGTTASALVSQPLPSASLNRRRFVHDLALFDAQTMIDGGYLLPMGQEAALRDLLKTYRQLPATGYKAETIDAQPLTIRTLRGSHDAFVYVVNDSPWPVQIELGIDAQTGCTITHLGRDELPRPVAPVGQREGSWTVSLEPYDLAAARFSHHNVQLRPQSPQVPAEVRDRLDQQVRQLVSRIASLGRLPPLDVLPNADFEADTSGGWVPGWQIFSTAARADRSPGGELAVDRKVVHRNPAHGFNGKQSLRIIGRGESAVVRSDLIPTPASGRLTLSMWLRSADVEPGAALRVAIEDAEGNVRPWQAGYLGGAYADTTPMPEDWTLFHIPINDLAVDGPERIRIRFDLTGTGTLWVDDLQLFDRSFSKSEQAALTKLSFKASATWKEERWRECQAVLDGYWPRFIAEHVPKVEPSTVRTARAPQRKESPADEDAGVLDRMREWVPKWW